MVDFCDIPLCMTHSVFSLPSVRTPVTGGFLSGRVTQKLRGLCPQQCCPSCCHIFPEPLLWDLEVVDVPRRMLWAPDTALFAPDCVVSDQVPLGNWGQSF